jgi:hypothetical protein
VGLWAVQGYRRSLRLSLTWGLVGAIAVGLFALYANSAMLLFVAIFGGFSCWQQWQVRQLGARWLGEPEEALEEPETGSQAGLLAGWRRRRAEAREQKARTARAQLEAEVDRILAKVHAEGLASLTAREKQALQRATDLEREAAQAAAERYR